jgi:DNA polymerase-3 subunit gamma/tau
MSDALINKYRPQSFAEVVGHAAIVRALEAALKKGTARAFLFTGSSGLGKTTLARIVATEAGCAAHDIQEIDAATNTGIDAMREVTTNLMYKPIGGTVKALVVDECHALSKQAWQALLKILEEPPPWVYWLLCTTEPNRVPKTALTRCLHLGLKPVGLDELVDLLEGVVEEEALKLPKGVAAFCAREAEGSPRQALSNLALCTAVTSLEEARELLSSAEGVPEAVELARALVRRARWEEIQGLLRALRDTDPESVRRVVQAYLTTVILHAKREEDAGKAMEILDAFATPMYHTSGLVLACGKVLLS